MIDRLHDLGGRIEEDHEEDKSESRGEGQESFSPCMGTVIVLLLPKPRTYLEITHDSN